MSEHAKSGTSARPDARARARAKDPAELLVGFARNVVSILSSAKSSPSDTAYVHPDKDHHQTFHFDGSPDLSIRTDCSGWINDAMGTVAPLHDAVLQGQRQNEVFDKTVYVSGRTVADPAADAPTITLDEKDRSYARADLLQRFFNGTTDDGHGFSAVNGTGFKSVSSIAHVQPGDLIAWAQGIYSDPTKVENSSQNGYDKPNETGHVMIADGKATPAWSADAHKEAKIAQQHGPSAEKITGKGFDTKRVTAVYAVRVIDSSNTPHFEDSQRSVDGGDGAKAKRDGVGSGLIWFATDSAGQVIQVRFDSKDHWISNNTTHASSSRSDALSVSIGRMSGSIDLSKVPLTNGKFLVTVTPEDRAALAAGTQAEERLTGHGDMLVQGRGTLDLTAGNTFVGNTTLSNAGTTLSIEANSALGHAASTLTMEDGTVLDVAPLSRKALNISHLVTLDGSATIEVKRLAHVDMKDAIVAGVGACDPVLNVTGGGHLELKGQTGSLGAVSVQDAGTALSLASQVGDGQVTLAADTELKIDRNITLDSLDISGDATVWIRRGKTLTVSAPIGQTNGSGVSANLQVMGDGELDVSQSDGTIARYRGGQTVTPLQTADGGAAPNASSTDGNALSALMPTHGPSTVAEALGRPQPVAASPALLGPTAVGDVDAMSSLRGRDDAMGLGGLSAPQRDSALLHHAFVAAA